ncbi:MAG: hypothetical protein QG654_298 [Patescibacteria group bacterium]|nr:hypothetical protein [Patescibacteria group bacterium]
MANYLKFIGIAQEFMLFISILILCLFPGVILFFPEIMTGELISKVYNLSLMSVFFVMAIRPLADLLPTVKWVRPLVILRKGFGVFSASIIVSFMIAKFIEIGFPDYILQYLDSSYWTISDLKLFAHLGDVTAVLLLITSNNFSKELLGKNWKRLQQLAYVYFYSGAIYEAFVFGSKSALFALITVFILVSSSFLYKNYKK